MSRIFCDLHLAACPDLTDGPERFRNYLEILIALRELLDGPTQIIRCDESLAALMASGRYPIRPALEQSVAAFACNVIEPGDAISILEAVVSKSTAIQDLTTRDKILFGDLNTTPSFTLNGRSAEQIASFDNLLTFTLMIDEELIAATAEIQCPSESVTIEASVEISEISNLPSGSTRSNKLRLCQTPEQLYNSLNVELIWSGCEDAKSLFHPIRAMERQEHPNSSHSSFKIEDSFIESCKAHGFMHDNPKIKRILRALSETLSRSTLTATHALREGSGPTCAQMRKGRYKGWRRDIDHEYHLHYWDDGSNVILAKVVTHNDFSIE